MPKLPQVSGKGVIKALKQIGFQNISQKGSHVKLIRKVNNQTQTITVPMHKILKKGTLKNGILNSIPLSVEEFTKLLRKN